MAQVWLLSQLRFYPPFWEKIERGGQFPEQHRPPPVSMGAAAGGCSQEMGDGEEGNEGEQKRLPPDVGIFDEAFTEIMKLMGHDALPRFKKSNFWKVREHGNGARGKGAVPLGAFKKCALQASVFLKHEILVPYILLPPNQEHLFKIIYG